MHIEAPGLLNPVEPLDDRAHDPDHVKNVAFQGMAPTDRITRVVITDGDGKTVIDQTNGVDRWEIKVYFDHQH